MLTCRSRHSYLDNVVTILFYASPAARAPLLYHCIRTTRRTSSPPWIRGVVLQLLQFIFLDMAYGLLVTIEVWRRWQFSPSPKYIHVRGFVHMHHSTSYFYVNGLQLSMGTQLTPTRFKVYGVLFRRNHNVSSHALMHTEVNSSEYTMPPNPNKFNPVSVHQLYQISLGARPRQFCRWYGVGKLQITGLALALEHPKNMHRTRGYPCIPPSLSIYHRP